MIKKAPDRSGVRGAKAQALEARRVAASHGFDLRRNNHAAPIAAAKARTSHVSQPCELVSCAESVEFDFDWPGDSPCAGADACGFLDGTTPEDDELLPGCGGSDDLSDKPSSAALPASSGLAPALIAFMNFRLTSRFF